MKKKNKSASHRGESDLRKAVKFVALFALLFLPAYSVLAYTPLGGAFGGIAADSSQFALKLLGVQTQKTVLENGSYALEGEGFVAELNQACAALIEIAVLFAIVFASFEKTLGERVKGFAYGTALLLLLNPVRIALSIIFIDPLVHDVLFRITLVITIIGFYAFWHYGELAKSKSFWLGMHEKIRLK
ncbi:MAG: hypothetical protein QXR53_03375 [Candidatus Norongarragalinales archaeon]